MVAGIEGDEPDRVKPHAGELLADVTQQLAGDRSAVGGGLGATQDREDGEDVGRDRGGGGPVGAVVELGASRVGFHGWVAARAGTAVATITAGITMLLRAQRRRALLGGEASLGLDELGLEPVQEEVSHRIAPVRLGGS